MTIEKLFAILKDGEWHSLTELSAQVMVQKNKLDEFLRFLSKQCIIEYENETHRLKIRPEWQNLLPDGN